MSFGLRPTGLPKKKAAGGFLTAKQAHAGPAPPRRPVCETTKTITIQVKGDSKKEANETFYLDLFGISSNALFTKNRGIGPVKTTMIRREPVRLCACRKPHRTPSHLALRAQVRLLDSNSTLGVACFGIYERVALRRNGSPTGLVG